MNLTTLEQILLDRIQGEFPLLSRPFEHLAQELGLEMDKLLEQLKKLKEERILRQISPIYDTKSLGYESSLVAMKVPQERLEEVAQWISSHPGVSHNYERAHEWNLWFTIAVPPDSALGLEGTVQVLAERAGSLPFLLLPTKKLFKIRVRLSLREKARQKTEAEVREEAEKENLPERPKAPSERDKQIICRTQWDLPLVEEPFRQYAEELEMEEAELLERLKLYRHWGWMRRFSGLLFHRRAGFRANGMVVWKVPSERISEVGTKFAKYSWVSHCYERPVHEHWPYPLFTMVHAKTQEELEEQVRTMAEEGDITEYSILETKREFKKIRLPYFIEEYYHWERKYGRADS